MRPSGALVALLLTVGCAATADERTYPLEGQIVAIRPAASEVTIRHEDIRGFMPGMTMPFRVADGSIAGRAPGDLVRATLVVRGTEAWIVALTKTGDAPLPPASELPVRGLAPGDRVPDAAFVDHRGRAFPLSDLDGHRTALTFTYTRCPLPTFCPAIDRRFSEAEDRLSADASFGDVRLVSFSIDPEYDTPEVLAEHAERVGAGERWRLATGAVSEIEAFGRQFGLAVTRESPAPADLEHNLRTVVLDRDRRIVTVLAGTDWTVDDLLAALANADGRAE